VTEPCAVDILKRLYCFVDISGCFVMRAGPKTHGLVIALAIGVMASALALAFGYAQLPSHGSLNKVVWAADANGNPVNGSKSAASKQ
jgi:hypothetical protein